MASIGTISEVINEINGISNTIATAVEEQNATNEMARNVSEAAHGRTENHRQHCGGGGSGGEHIARGNGYPESRPATGADFRGTPPLGRAIQN